MQLTRFTLSIMHSTSVAQSGIVYAISSDSQMQAFSVIGAWCLDATRMECCEVVCMAEQRGALIQRVCIAAVTDDSARSALPFFDHATADNLQAVRPACSEDDLAAYEYRSRPTTTGRRLVDCGRSVLCHFAEAMPRPRPFATHCGQDLWPIADSAPRALAAAVEAQARNYWLQFQHAASRFPVVFSHSSFISITSPQVGCEVLSSACLYVCLSFSLFVRLHIWKLHDQISLNLLHMLTVPIARSSSDGNAIRYVLPVCG